MNGELALTRTVTVGAGKLADFFGKTGTADLKAGKMEDFQAKVHGLISTLAKELSASIDFFETQSEAKVTEIIVSGGAARSQFILQSLEAELEIPCESWTPAKCRDWSCPSEKGMRWNMKVRNWRSPSDWDWGACSRIQSGSIYSRKSRKPPRCAGATPCGARAGRRRARCF